ncbi:SDR family oxidoreductase [Mesorhizobium sp. Root102]|uniref:SDR family oxidoreductase n=1 Tax=Mesorhizobium sp. Root102 TaxID=1736422 RepID=UPI0009EB6F4D|nr:SDR family oxidoreductase [Mesorhizobium sp. Root102]
MQFDGLDGLRVVVTAAGGGAGRVIAARFHRAGAHVVACDLDRKGLRDLEQDCPRLVGVESDAGNEEGVEQVFAVVREKLGGIDVLVNNVGISGPTAPAEKVTLDEWNQSIRVNLTSHFLFARAAIPLMKDAQSGLIVNISSGSAKVGLPLRLPYVVSKGAVLALTTNLARELGPFGIRVNAILPGAIRGPRLDRVIQAKAEALGIDPKEHERSVLRYVSLRTMVEPDDIAAMILFLASPGGSRVTGQLIGVDGNMEWEE